MNDTWVDGYYEALDFFFWEPHHLGRMTNPAARYKGHANVQEHIRRLEVTLNHQIKFFFSLAPDQLRNRIFESVFSKQRLAGTFSADAFSMDDGQFDTTYELKGKVQPDLLFTSEDVTVSVEMKINAKSDPDQVLKYALLALAVEQKKKHKMEHFLLFLGKHTFSGLWTGLCNSVEDLRSHLDLNASASTFLQGKPAQFQREEARFLEIVSTLSFGFVNYGELAGLLEKEITPTDKSDGAEVYSKLVGGMVRELRRRDLAPVPLPDIQDSDLHPTMV
jgi:hypothetical protein